MVCRVDPEAGVCGSVLRDSRPVGLDVACPNECRFTVGDDDAVCWPEVGESVAAGVGVSVDVSFFDA